MYAGICTFTGLIALGTREKPPTPPSASASEKSTSFVKGLKEMRKNYAYMATLISFSMGAGTFNTLTTILDQIILPLGYTEADTTVFLACIIGVGLLSAFISATILDKYHFFKEFFVTGEIITTLGFLWFSISCSTTPDSFPLLIVPLVIVAIASFMVLSTALELSVELLFPVAPATSTGFMWMGTMFVTIVALFISNALMSKY